MPWKERYKSVGIADFYVHYNEQPDEWRIQWPHLLTKGDSEHSDISVLTYKDSWSGCRNKLLKGIAELVQKRQSKWTTTFTLKD